MRSLALVGLGWLIISARAPGADVNVSSWGKTRSSTVVGTARASVELEAGYFHTLARRGDGSVVAWGSNGAGECDTPPFRRASRTSSWRRKAHSVARRSDGSLVARGSNLYGQCSIPPVLPGRHLRRDRGGKKPQRGAVEQRLRRRLGREHLRGVQRSALPTGIAYVEITAGDQHTVARRSDGSVVAWGDNPYGQCNVPALPPE